MKKYNVLKTIQMVLFLIFALGCGYLIFSRYELYHAIANDPAVKAVCAMLWACLGLCFVFILVDFGFIGAYKKDYRELDFAVHSDPLSGLANRHSCDRLIEKYLDKPLPKDVGCVMVELSNIMQINEEFGHAAGNDAIRDFSNILKMASVSLCFVGRNGGNKFLALFEDCTRQDIDAFLERMDKKVCSYNSDAHGKCIQYRYGVAFEEGPEVKTITDLVALSNSRIYKG